MLGSRSSGFDIMSSDGAAPGTGSAATVMDIDQGVETWRYLLRMTKVWPPPPVISQGGPLLLGETHDEIVEYIRELDKSEQAIMTVSFVHLMRFLMVEVSEACHTASVLSNGPGDTGETDAPGEEVDVEVDEQAFMQVSAPDVLMMKTGRECQQAGRTEVEEVQFMQTGFQFEREARWHRALVQLQKELTQQHTGMRQRHLMLLRGRLFSVVDTLAWTAYQDQLYALILAMLDTEKTREEDEDKAWVQARAERLAEFAPGLEVPVRIVQEPIPVDSQEGEQTLLGECAAAVIDRHVKDEHEEQDMQDKEDATRLAQLEMLQREEDEMLVRQAAEYRNWEDWVIQQDMDRSTSLGPVRRKRTVLELEVHGGHLEGPRWVRQQRIILPEQGEINIRLAARVEEEIPESEIETVVPPVEHHENQKPQTFGEMDYAMYCVQFEAWRTGAVTDQEILGRFGRDVLSMMQAQRVADQGTQLGVDDTDKTSEKAVDAD